MPTETGIYLKEEIEYGHLHSKSLLNNITHIIDNSLPVIDFGCGTGYYVEELNKKGYKAIGVDGIYIGDNKDIKILDISEHVDLGIKGNVISLEVGEHIPEQKEDIFISNLINHCSNILILSWAVEGQMGIGHINCKNNNYIINKLIDYGFEFSENMTKILKHNIEQHCNYFYNTLMGFKKI